jgi:hypothetical protein
MAASEVAHFFTRYATSFSAPILDHTAVEHVAHDDHGFLVATDRGQFRARNIVVATGWCDRPAIPAAARQLSARIHQVVPSEYRAPEDLPAGGVLVVGAVIGAADQHMRRVLERIDGAVERLGLTSEVLAPEAIAVAEPGDAPQSIHLAHEAITSVVWATGHTRRYEWLDLPILDELGEIRQRRGVTAVAGAYVLGQRFQHYRNSNFIDGVGRDAEFVADHICTRAISLGSHPSIRSRQN